MTQFYLWLLISICSGLLIWGLFKPERVYQYPFFMGAMFMSWLIPQATSLVEFHGAASQEAVERVLLYASMCAAMCWLGYQSNPKKSNPLLNKLAVPLDENRLFQAAVGITIISWSAKFMLGGITIQTSAEAGGNWTGSATILLFFKQTGEIAFPIFLLLALYKFTYPRLIGAIIAGYPIFESAFFAARRQRTMIFVIIIALTLYYVYRFVIPRFLAIGTVFAGAFVIPLISRIRARFWTYLFQGNFDAIDWDLGMETVQEGKILELRNAAMYMEASVQTGQSGFGTGFWDNIIFRYFPGQWFGYALKNGLQFHLTNFDLVSLFGYSVPPGSTITGVGDTFLEFSYLGCLLFALQARFYKELWLSATYNNLFASQVLYSALFSPALVGLTHGFGRFIQDGLFQVIFLSLAIFYARQKQRNTLGSESLSEEFHQ